MNKIYNKNEYPITIIPKSIDDYNVYYKDKLFVTGSWKFVEEQIDNLIIYCDIKKIFKE